MTDHTNNAAAQSVPKGGVPLDEAWARCRAEVGTEGWTTGEAFNYRGFFEHGYRAALAASAPTVGGAEAALRELVSDIEASNDVEFTGSLFRAKEALAGALPATPSVGGVMVARTASDDLIGMLTPYHPKHLEGRDLEVIRARGQQRWDELLQCAALAASAPTVGGDVVQQALTALRIGVREINHLGGARQAVPLHDAIAAILATQEPSAAAEPVADGFPHEEIDATVAARYKIVDSETSVFGGKAITVGDGTQQVYHGRNGDCRAVAVQLRRAFADGAFWMHGRRATPPTPPSAPAGAGEGEQS